MDCFVAKRLQAVDSIEDTVLLEVVPAPSVSGFGASPAPALRPVRVLVADDERDIVLTLEAILRDEGYETQGAYNGDEVLEKARATRPDAVILDIQMPGISGFAVARELRETYPLDRPPLLIAITGKWIKSSDRLLGALVGFDHYLLKPCDPQAVLKLLAPLKTPVKS
jgi:CheY-like chemotaxis protein